MLELQNISFGVSESQGKKEILKDISLTVGENKFVVITGPNGGGKSTLAKMIMGIEKPRSGKILFDGQDITEKTITERANLGISFALQQPVRFKGLTVRDLLEMAAGKPLEECEVCALVGKVGLCASEYIDREVDASLSGGEAKRIEIATVLARGAKLSIFDEPEAGIDLWSFSKLVETFQELQKSHQGTLLIISHQERILSIADEIVVIADGVVREAGPREEVMPHLMMGESMGCMCPLGKEVRRA